MTEITTKIYDLEARTFEFARGIIAFCKLIPKGTVNFELISQLVRSGTSVGANYREANEALSKKDFSHRIAITRKEAKETSYWLELLKESNPQFRSQIEPLLIESRELRNIFTAIINKTK